MGGLLSAPVSEVPASHQLNLVRGWNALASPLKDPVSIGAISGRSGADEQSLVYGQCFTGELGKFQQEGFQTGYSMRPGQVVWVYAYHDCRVNVDRTAALAASTAAAGTPPPKMGSVPSQPGVWRVKGTVRDDSGQVVAHAKIYAKCDYGKVSLETDLYGRFSIALKNPPASVPHTSLRMAATAPGLDDWKRTVTLPLKYPLDIKMHRKTALVYVQAYKYHWGEQDYHPVKIYIWSTVTGNSKQVTDWFRGNSSYSEVKLTHWPMGSYRMIITWKDRKGYDQTITRDGNITQSVQTIRVYNSWSYN
jgi:hypothetical protein